MKSIILSIHKRHAENIFAGLKTLEIRKSRPAGKGEFPYIIYMYETKSSGSGLVVGEFICNGTVKTNCFDPFVDCLYIPGKESKAGKYCQYISKRACLSEDELVAYACKGKKAGEPKTIVAWDVTKPVRYQNPLPLSDFGLYTAPQSWQYINKVELPYI